MSIIIANKLRSPLLVTLLMAVLFGCGGSKSNNPTPSPYLSKYLASSCQRIQSPIFHNLQEVFVDKGDGVAYSGFRLYDSYTNCQGKYLSILFLKSIKGVNGSLEDFLKNKGEATLNLAPHKDENGTQLFMSGNFTYLEAECESIYKADEKIYPVLPGSKCADILSQLSSLAGGISSTSKVSYDSKSKILNFCDIHGLSTCEKFIKK